MRAAQGRRGGAQPVYQAPSVDAALEAFKASELGRATPRSAQLVEDAWERFAPFLAFPPELRRVIYTTNAIAICSIEDKRARDGARERGLRRGSKPKADGRLVEEQVVTNWMKAVEQLALVYPERIELPLAPRYRPLTHNLTSILDAAAGADPTGRA